MFPNHIKGVSLDFANTIYPLNRAEMIETVGHLHRFLEHRLGESLPVDTLSELYFAIRDRQFAENKSTLRDNDFPMRLREMITHVHESPSDELVQAAADAYATGFIASMRLVSEGLETIRALSSHFAGNVAVCSNFIRTDCITEPLRRDGILPLLNGVVVSCDVGYVKPHPLMFQTVCNQLGLKPSEIVHVGDDLNADILGARSFGMTTVYTREFCPTASDDEIVSAAPDFVIDNFKDLIRFV